MREIVGVLDLEQLRRFIYCPYCGSNLMDITIGDYHAWTNCSDCDNELEAKVRVLKGDVLRR